MRRKASILWIIIVLTVNLPACTSQSFTQNEMPTGIKLGLNLLIVVDGEAQLKRDGWQDYHSTAFGAEIYPGDLLKPGNDSKIVLLCSDLTTRNVPPGVVSGLTNLCPQPAEPALKLDDSQYGNTRGGSDPLIPYIISPRATGVLDETPILRWNPSPGTIHYTVQIKEGADLIWSTETSNTQLTYPGQPSLKPKVTYLVIIKADNGKTSQDEGVAGLGFHLLADDELQNVQRDADRITILNLTNEAKVYALAQLYAGNGLNAEAIESLEALVNGGSQIPALQRTLGDFYQQINLTLLAETHYRRAVELSDRAVDLEGLSAAQAGLGLAYATLGNPAEAIRWLEEAKTGYKELGDELHVQEMENQLYNLR